MVIDQGFPGRAGGLGNISLRQHSFFGNKSGEAISRGIIVTIVITPVLGPSVQETWPLAEVYKLRS
jgi:hypothetical protein